MSNPFTSARAPTSAGLSGLDLLMPDVALQQQQAARQQALAEALRQQALTADDTGTQFAGGWAIPNGFSKPLSRLANALGANIAQRGADEKQQALAEALATRMQGGLSGAGAAGSSGGPDLNTVLTFSALGITPPPSVVERLFGVGKKMQPVNIDAGGKVKTGFFDPETGAITFNQDIEKGVTPDTGASIASREKEGALDRGTTERGQNLSAATAARGQAIDWARLLKGEVVKGDNGAVYNVPPMFAAGIPGFSNGGLPTLPAATPAPQGAPTGAPAAPAAATAPGVQTLVLGKTLQQRAAEEGVLAGARKSAEASAERTTNAAGVTSLLKEAEGLLRGVDVTRPTTDAQGNTVFPKVAMPTGSGIGAGVDYAQSLVGKSNAGAETADRLAVLGGALVTKVPRLNGPQSDRDAALYREMAGRIGDSSIPIERRLAALKSVQSILGKYDQEGNALPAGGAAGGAANLIYVPGKGLVPAN